MTELGGERNVESCFYRTRLVGYTGNRRDVVAVRNMVRDSLLQRDQNFICINLTLCLVKVQ